MKFFSSSTLFFISSKEQPNQMYIMQDNYGFIPSKEEEPQQYAAFEQWKPTFHVKNKKQVKRWQTFLHARQAIAAKRKQKYELSSKDKSSNDIKKMARKGIPPEFRGRVWFQLSGAAEKKEMHPGYYEQIIKTHKNQVSTATKQADAVRIFF